MRYGMNMKNTSSAANFNLKEQLINRHETITAISLKTNISRQTLYNIENGKFEPRKSTERKLIKYFKQVEKEDDDMRDYQAERQENKDSERN